jgi:hypothetical protein
LPIFPVGKAINRLSLSAVKNDKGWLTLQDNLKEAPGFEYDKASTTWVPATK